MIPLFHDFTAESVLVLGGGPVGARRARLFAREARVVVVASAFVNEDFGDATCRRQRLTTANVTAVIDDISPALVVAATDDERINDAAEMAARERSILVNRADRGGSRAVDNVAVPATIRDSPVTVAVGTDGRAPVVSAVLKEEIAAQIETAGPVAELVSELREELSAVGVPEKHRREALEQVVRSSAVRDALAVDEPEQARETAREILDGWSSGSER